MPAKSTWIGGGARRHQGNRRAGGVGQVVESTMVHSTADLIDFPQADGFEAVAA
jgi:hypothetical protein